MAWLLLVTVTYQILMFFVSLGLDVSNDNGLLSFIDGVLDNGTQFQMLVMAPLLLSTEYRITQELTPMGTIIGSNFLLVVLFGNLLTNLTLAVFGTSGEVCGRLICILYLTISLIIIVYQAKDE